MLLIGRCSRSLPTSPPCQRCLAVFLASGLCGTLLPFLLCCVDRAGVVCGAWSVSQPARLLRIGAWPPRASAIACCRDAFTGGESRSLLTLEGWYSSGDDVLGGGGRWGAGGRSSLGQAGRQCGGSSSGNGRGGSGRGGGGGGGVAERGGVWMKAKKKNKRKREERQGGDQLYDLDLIEISYSTYHNLHRYNLINSRQQYY